MVLCQGDCEKAPRRAEYCGVPDCRQALNANGGTKACRFGCLGYGTCVKACKFGVLKMGPNGLPVVDRDKCTACNACVTACPRGVMQFVPYDHDIRVNCQNTLSSKYVRQDCSIGCIACMRCVKVCPTGTAQAKNNLSSIDYEKCIQYGLCVEACPTNCLMGQKVKGELEQWEEDRSDYVRPENKPQPVSKRLVKDPVVKAKV